MELVYTATLEDTNKTVKDIILNAFNISHRLLITIKRENAVFINNAPSHLWQTVKNGDIIRLSLSYAEDNTNIMPKPIPLDIIYEDTCFLIVNKSAGTPVHPSISHYEDSLSNGVRYYFDKVGLKKKIRPVNRIDKNTSGLVVFAKNEYVQECLIRQMKNGIFMKEYIAIVEGHFDNKKRNN